MASNSGKSSKSTRRSNSKKSHSWWWDSHINSKNSKWLQENLEKMDQNIKRMLKLIEEDGDSFAKKAEMYYQKRPELINLVEDFYRMYRSLAERYDNVTGELRKNIPSDLQSQGSGISGVGSEPASSWPSPDLRPSRPKSGPRPAGFEFFLGGGGNTSDFCNKEGDESSTLDSEEESDDSSSINNYLTTLSNDDDHGLRRKITDLESELREVKEKVHSKGSPEILLDRVTGFEDELRIANERIQVSEDEIMRLRIELQKYESGLSKDSPKDSTHSEAEVLDPEEFKKIQTLEEELKMTKEEVKSLRHKLDKEKREVSKLHDRIARYKTNLSERDQEIRGLRESISNSNKTLSEENSQLQDEITKLSKERAFLEDNIKEMDVRCQCLEEEMRRALAGKSEIEQLRTTIVEREDQVEELKLENAVLVEETEELKARFSAISEELNSRDDRIDEVNKNLHELHVEHVELMAEAEGARKMVDELRLKVQEMDTDIKRQQEVIQEGAEEKREAIRQLCFSLEHYRNGYHRLRQVVMGNKRLPVVMAS